MQFIDKLIYDYFYLKIDNDYIINLIKSKPQLREQFLIRIPIVISQMPAQFPIIGIVSKLDNYYYIKLNDNGNYIIAISKLLNAIEIGYGFSKLVNNNLLKYNLFIIPPLSPVGSHVTIGKNINPNLIGKEIKFTLANLASYFDSRGGLEPSNLDKHFYPIKWYVIYVNGIPSDLIKNYYDQPHISVGVLGYRL